MFKPALFAAALAWASAGVLPAHAQDWRRADSPLFTVYSDGREEELREAVGDLHEFDAIMRRVTLTRTPPTEHKLEVYLYRNRARFDSVLDAPDDQMAGFYSAAPEIVSAHAMFRAGRGLEAQEVLFHEYAHHFMYQYFAAYYPPWYVEGFAEFMSTTRMERERVVVGDYPRGRAGGLLRGEWIPFERFLTVKLSDLREVERSQYYGQSWLFVHYCVMTPGRAADLTDYLVALREPGADPVAAFSDAFRATPDEMQRILHAYLRDAISVINFTRAPNDRGGEFAITRLGPAAARLLPLDARVRYDPAQEQRPALLANIRNLAAEFPGDTFAQHSLARAEIMMALPQTGRAILEPLLATDPNDVEALYLMGLSYMREAEADESRRGELSIEARRYFVRASRIDPNHVPTLYHYVESYYREAGQLRPATIDVLVHARNLAPQVGTISFMAGQALMDVGRYDEAIAALTPVATDPHSGGSSGAQQLIDEARARAAAPH